MGPDKSNYRDQGVQGGSQFESPNRQFRNRVRYEREEEECRRGDVEGAEGLSWRKRRQPLVDDEYTDSLGAQEERSLASYGSWEAGSQALGISTSGSKPETFLAPYGTYDMDDSSFFAHTTRLNIVGPKSDSTRILGRRSSCAERSLGERTMATSFQKTERLRSSSPAVVPTKPTSPTESYMKLSLQFSHPLVDPTTSRKLLVLDLNGTLLLRSSRRAPPPPYFSSKRPAPHPHPALRIVYPRPYLPSFRAYLFHPTTLQWLDTMVWSSAQPHSVNDMVDKCFGMYRKDLKAVWARDTLGLTGDEYYKKTQTTKDLAKLWAEIPSLISKPYRNQSPSHASESPSSEIEADRNSHVTLLQQQHSALTTVLMDDSPLKAILQPWNHLCVSEYKAATRQVYVGIAERECAKEAAAAAEEEERRSDGAATNGDTADEENDKETERKRKRKERKMFKKRQKLLPAKEDTQGKEDIQVGRVAEEEESYDELLLAVIGILDGLKYEGNVAGWMRSGGLMHTGDQQAILGSNHSPRTPEPTSENAEVMTPTTATTTLSPRTKRDGSPMSIPGLSTKRRRLLTHGNNSSDPDSDPEMVLPTTPKRSSSISPPSSSQPSSPLYSAQGGQVSIGVPLISTTTTSTPTPARKNPILSIESQPLLWYENPSVLTHWAHRGRRALAELGIEIVSGVVPPNQNGNSAGSRQNLLLEAG